MGGPGLERELVRARSAYVADVHYLHAVIQAFHEVGVPLHVPSSGPVRPWSKQQVSAVLGMREAWTRIARSRRAMEGLARELRMVQDQ